jgi:disulfide bond formation protein DsbB
MNSLRAYWPSLAAAAQLLAVCGVLLGSLSYQFILGELPCPLCVIQRLSFLLACVGLLAILFDDGTRPDAPIRQARGFAFCIFAALAGACASIRQILLHIVPPDAGYGPPVLGLHLYSWALLVFVCMILGSGIGLLGIGAGKLSLPRPVRFGIAGLVTLIAVTIALATFAMEGFRFLLPDNPDRYELFRQLRISA